MSKLKRSARELKERNRNKVIKRHMDEKKRKEAFKHKGKKTDLILWLDVDHTILDHEPKYKASLDNMIVTPRPDLQEFLRLCKRIFKEVNVNTAAGRAATMLKLKACKFVPNRIMTYEDLKYGYRKNMTGYFSENGSNMAVFKRIPEFDASKTIVVDDIAAYYEDHVYNNVIQVRPFHNDKHDGVFFEVLAYHLKAIAYSGQTRIENYVSRVVTEDTENFTVKHRRALEGNSCSP